MSMDLRTRGGAAPLLLAVAAAFCAAATIVSASEDAPSAAGESTSSYSPPSTLRGGDSDSSSRSGNMNGPYLLSPTPGAANTSELFPPDYASYPASPSGSAVEYFDVYSPPISTLYSQVFWKGLPPVPLPSDVVSRFDGKGMAVVGFEVDQVRTNDEGEEVGVPITFAYNHHFESTMIGGGAAFAEVKPGEDGYGYIGGESEGAAHGHGHGRPAGQTRYAVIDPPAATGLPTRQDFGAANGGEFRKSFHGYPPSFAQTIQSPTEFQITPMQIDTWNRDGMDLDRDGGRGGKFVPGPLPRSSLAPREGAEYSGLLECPLTTRIKKNVERDFTARMSGTCAGGGGGGGVIQTAAECRDAARAVFPTFNGRFELKEGEDASKPEGCSATSSADGRTMRVFFNDADAGGGAAECGARGGGGGERDDGAYAGSATSLINVTLQLDPSAQDAASQATVTLTGPSDAWFGIGFGAQAMKDEPYAIIVDGDDGWVSERKLGDQNPGSELEPSVEVVSNSVGEDGSRTVVLARSMAGKTQDYYTFRTDAASVPFINAVGSTAELSYHKARAPSSLPLLPVESSAGAGACLCTAPPPPFGSARGTLEYVPTSQPGEEGQSSAVSFWNKCEARPRSDLLEMRNPTCDLREYAGGQLACHHMWSLLDSDQSIPWTGTPLEYRLKFRFWYQEYDPSYHAQVTRTTWGIASPVEYDVPECGGNGRVEGCEWEEENHRWVHTIRGTFEPTPELESMRLIAAHFHCHAPTCLSVELYLCPEEGEAAAPDGGACDDSTGRLLCRQEPVYGAGAGLQRPSSSGMGEDDASLPPADGDDDDGRFDELGYMNAQPPCLWGSAEFGLEDPVDVSGRRLHAVKKADATVGHHGEMAWLQIYYF